MDVGDGLHVRPRSINLGMNKTLRWRWFSVAFRGSVEIDDAQAVRADFATRLFKWLYKEGFASWQADTDVTRVVEQTFGVHHTSANRDFRA